jgi:hypothetical protein
MRDPTQFRPGGGGGAPGGGSPGGGGGGNPGGGGGGGQPGRRPLLRLDAQVGPVDAHVEIP